MASTCIRTGDDLKFLLEQEPLTQEQTLQLLKLAYQKMVYAVACGESVTYLEIRNRRVQFVDPEKMLRFLRDAIAELEDVVNTRTRSARNVATLKGF